MDSFLLIWSQLEPEDEIVLLHVQSWMWELICVCWCCSSLLSGIIDSACAYCLGHMLCLSPFLFQVCYWACLLPAKVACRRQRGVIHRYCAGGVWLPAHFVCPASLVSEWCQCSLVEERYCKKGWTVCLRTPQFVVILGEQWPFFLFRNDGFLASGFIGAFFLFLWLFS